MKVVIIICIIWIIGIFFVGWKFIDDRMKRNKLEHAMSLAQHNPKEAVEYLREHIGNQNMPSWQEEKIAESYETVNRLYPQNADWQDWAYLVECDAIIWHNGMGGMLSQLDPEARELLSAVSMRRNPEQQYAREKRAREERAREERAREERRNRWVIVQLAGRPEFRFDISNDKGRASLIRWYNNTFHPEFHDSRLDNLSVTAARDGSGRLMTAKVEKAPAMAIAPARIVGKVIMRDAVENVVYDLAKEGGSWTLKKGLIWHPWAHIENERADIRKRRVEMIKRIQAVRRNPNAANLHEPLLHIPGTDPYRANLKTVDQMTAIEQSRQQAQRNRDFQAKLAAEDELERLMVKEAEDNVKEPEDNYLFFLQRREEAERRRKGDSHKRGPRDDNDFWDGPQEPGPNGSQPGIPTLH